MLNMTCCTLSNRIRTIHTMTHELANFSRKNWQWRSRHEEALKITLYLHLKSEISEHILLKFDILGIIYYLLYTKFPFMYVEQIKFSPKIDQTLQHSVDKKNQLDVTFCILYFSSNSYSTCFGQPCAHHQELTTAWFYSLVLVCAVAAGRWSRL